MTAEEPRSGALPFYIRRSDDVVDLSVITSTYETVHGLLHLEGERLTIQWRVGRKTERVGMAVRTDREVDPVQEIVVPVSLLASATVKAPWWSFGTHLQVALIANDLRAFEDLSGTGGFRLDHPAELVVRVRKSDREAAEEFAGKLELAMADFALRIAERGRLEPAPSVPRLPDIAT
ncbi:MAG: hypothetical protein ACSLFK_10930 [Gemmatimonadaceae bacterium]